MPDLTLVVSPHQGWKVYRVRTLSSEYHLAVFAGAPGRRPCAILRGLSRGLGQVIDLQDSAPLIGGQPLYVVPPSQWVGKSLELGTATTSPVQSVELELNPEVIASLTHRASQPTAEPQDTSELGELPAPAAARGAAAPTAPWTPPAKEASRAGRHRIFVGKDTHKFSSAHMTVFADGTKERLHGHNFLVSVALDLTARGVEQLLDLGLVKRALVDQCAAWDQRLLLAARSPAMAGLRQAGGECEFTLCGRRYVVPGDEVLLLPVDNVTVETLSEAFARALVARLGAAVLQGSVSRVEVTITESHNQGGTFELMLDESQ